MDAWSSPWNDTAEDVQRTPSSAKLPEQIQDDAVTLHRPSPPPFASLNSFDASDPWSADAPAATAEPDLFPSRSDAADDVVANSLEHESATFPSQSLTSPAWRDDSVSGLPELRPSLEASPSEDPALQQLPEASIPVTPPTQQQSLSSYDPWAADSSTSWGAEPQVSTSAVTATPDSEVRTPGWGASADELEHRFSSTHLDSPTGDVSFDQPRSRAEDVDEDNGKNEAGTNLDVWAAEASSRKEKARQLDREEIDKLKVDARKLISNINTEAETQASFADPSIGQAEWTDLFGSQGTQRDKLSHLQTPPSALMSSSGALRSDIMQSSPATLNQVRSSIAKTENRGVRLASADNNSLWQRGARPITKADWLPDAMTGGDDFGFLGKANGGGKTTTASSSTSGPGWVQTSNNDARSTSGPSFLASFFKGRQASAASASTIAGAESGPSQATTQGKDSRSSTPPSRESPIVSGASQFESYTDNTTSRYSDDPTGPDLMSLDTATTAPASAASTAAQAPAAPAQGAGLLSRWRNSGLFAKSAKKPNPGWASTALKGDDLNWLDEQDQSTDSRTRPYRYDDEDAEDSFASFQNTGSQPPLPAKMEPSTSAHALDPFDNLFGPAVSQTNANPKAPATSSARSSLSASRMSGEGGMMTINTNLIRGNSLARKNAVSPLQPPPQGQNKRMSIAPPPRVNNASPSIASPGLQVRAAPSDPFADFLSDPPPSQPQQTVKAPPAATAASKGPSKSNGTSGLTADDLLFFDSL